MKEVNRQRLVQYFFFAVFLILLYQFALILSPFYIALLGSTILALTIFPLHARIYSRLSRYPSLAAGVTTALIVLIVVLPVLLFGWVFLKETAKVYPAAKAWIAEFRSLQTESGHLTMPPQLQALWDRAARLLDFWNIDLQDILLKNLDELSSTMTHMATSLIKNTLFVGFNLAVLAFTLFFFLRDGPFIIRRLIELVPMSEDHKQSILERVQETLFAVLRGVLIVAAVQGLLAGIGFAVLDVPFPVLLGVLTTLLAPIPFVGTMGVWVPVAACLALTGHARTAIYLSAWCVLVVGTIDNLLRPLLIGSTSKIPILLLFFGLLGGLRVYGFTGLLVGPLVIALVLAFINIYRQEYHWLLQPPKDSR